MSQINYTTTGWFRNLPKKIESTDTMSFQDFAMLSIRELTNTDEDTFLYKGHVNFSSPKNINNENMPRFKHEDARVGGRFTDGNNGDYWRVVASAAAHKRLIVQNITQDFMCIMVWK